MKKSIPCIFLWLCICIICTTSNVWSQKTPLSDGIDHIQQSKKNDTTIFFTAIPNLIDAAGTTEFKYDAISARFVRVDVFDALGNCVFSAGPAPVKSINGLRTATIWNLGKQQISSGTYIAILTIIKKDGTTSKVKTSIGVRN